MTEAEGLVRAYYDAFNALSEEGGDREGFLALLTEDVEHGISQGGSEAGRDAFGRFMAHMDRCYRERITDLVVMVDATGTRAAAEFVVHGTSGAPDPGGPKGTPEASGQSYSLPAGAFFTLRDGRVARISNHYNLGDWVRQVGGKA